MSSPDGNQVQRLIDQADIEELIHRYSRAIDLKDYSMLDTCFLADAHLDYSKAGGVAGAYPEVRKWLEEVLEPLTEMQHLITNISVEIDGDTASGYCYTLNINGMPEAAGGGHLIVGAMYTDEIVRIDGSWKFKRRAEQRLTEFTAK